MYPISTTNPPDHYWKIIQAIATNVLDDYHANRLKFQQRDQIPLESRFSFTRAVPRALYNRQASKPSLKDGGSSIVILDEEEETSKGYIARL